MNILTYVHLRNIYQSTGAGRVARELTEHLALFPEVRMRILADSGDYQRIIPHMGSPWTEYDYAFTRRETSRQQAQWFLTGSPKAQHYWPEAEIVYCTAESYVPAGRSRLAVTLHDAAIFEAGAHRLTAALLKQRAKWRLLFHTLARRADLFHTVSQFSAERISHFFPSMSSRMRVVHNAVSSHFFEPVDEPGAAALRRLGLGGKPFVLLPGGLHWRKNADLVLSAWPLLRARHPGLELVVINHSDAAYAERAKTLGSSVRLEGFLEEAALRAAYSAAQVVWFPSRYEGFGMPVLEAMACGTPVVTSNCASLPEIAGSAAILVPPHDAGAHADAIDGLLRHGDQRRDFSERGRERARRFTWRASATSLRDHFAAVLA